MWGSPSQANTAAGGAQVAPTLDDFWLQTPSKAVQATVASDFWMEPVQSDAPVTHPQDFWILVPDSEPSLAGGEAIEALDWDLPRFDPELATRPHIELPARSRDESLARRRSRWLVQLLDIPSQSQRRQFRNYFDDLFAEFNSANTFRALSHLAVEGAPAGALRNACECKRTLLQSSHLLMRRGPSLTVYVPLSGAVGLVSWARAYRLAMLCGGDDPMDHIDESWIDTWLALPPSEPTYWVLLDYCESMLNLKAMGYWELPATPRMHVSSDHLFDNRGYAAWARSAGGQMMYGAPTSVGVMHLEPRRFTRLLGGKSGARTADRGVLAH